MKSSIPHTMTRRESRESAFLILFEKIFNDIDVKEIIDTAKLVRTLSVNEFTLNIVNGVLNNQDSIDNVIDQNTKNWKKTRLSKVSLLLLRIATYEMIFCKDIPISVSINEAVELSKKYSTKEETAFINGVLGGVSKKVEEV